MSAAIVVRFFETGFYFSVCYITPKVDNSKKKNNVRETFVFNKVAKPSRFCITVF